MARNRRTGRYRWVMKLSRYTVMPSPVGPLTLRAIETTLAGVYFANAPALAERSAWIRDDAALAFARIELEQYFAGERETFELPLALEGTPFQVRVWQALRDIPFGTTTSYGELARRIGNASGQAARAVGAANGQNPICIIVPCHRVIGADGSLTGFGGGLPRKKWLLAHEGRADTRVSNAQTRLAFGARR
jgi:methylated-DNA-[protein]-cysteine S-methyltransferase